MTDPNTKLLPVSGMLPDYGPFTTAPEGALVDANNVQLRVPGVVEPRGSFTWSQDTQGAPFSRYYSLGCFSDPLGTHVYNILTDGSTAPVMRRDDAYTVTGRPGATPAKFTSGKVFAAHAMSQDYFTSDQGVYVLNDPTVDVTARTAGMPRPTYCWATPAGGTTWLSGTVGYRAVFVKNPSTYPIYSPPSAMAILGYPGANPFVVVKLDTSYLEVGDQVQIYRSIISNPDYTSGIPSDEMRLRYTFTLTSSNLASGFVSFTDKMADSTWSGPSLYTNATQEGISQASWRPGLPQDIAYFNNMMFYGGMASRQRLVITCKAIDTSGTSASPSEVLETYTFSGTTTSGSNTVTGVAAADIAHVFVGQEITTYVAGVQKFPGAVSNFPAGTHVTAVGASSITCSANATATGATSVSVYDVVMIGSDKIYAVPSNAAIAIGTAFFRSTPASGAGYSPQTASMVEMAYNGTYSSGINFYVDATNSTSQNLGLQFFLESDTVDGSTFTVKSSKPLAFDKYVDYSTGVTSSRDYYSATSSGSAYIFYSKASQPEAVPLGNFNILGDEQSPIMRLMATKECLWVFKTDGVWRVSGDDPSTLRFDQFDPTLQMFPNAPLANAVERFDNDVFVWSKKGIFRLSDSGAQQIDMGIRQYMLEQGYGNFDDVTYAYTAHSQVDRWVMFCPRWSTDPSASKMFVYWPDTGTWTYWTFANLYNFVTAAGGISRTTGHEDILFASGIGTVRYRWDPTRLESTSTIADQLCADQWIASPNYVTLSAVSGTSGTADNGGNSFFSPVVGDAILQGGHLYFVTSVSGYDFTVDRAGLVDGAVTGWFTNFPVRVLWSATPGAGLGVHTHFEKATFAFDQVRGGENFTYEFQGYQNGTLKQVSTTYYLRDSSNNTVTPDGTYGVPSGIPLVAQVAVPHDGPRHDWGIKVGFSSAQAGQYFRINGCAIHWNPVETKITR